MNRLTDQMLLDIPQQIGIDVSGVTLSGDWFDMSNWDTGLLVIRLSDKNLAPDVTLRLQAAEDAMGANEETVKSAALGDPAEGLYAFDIRTEDLPQDKHFVSFQVQETVAEGASIAVRTAIAGLNPHKKYENVTGAIARYGSWE